MHPFIAALQWVLLSTPVGRLLVQVTCLVLLSPAQAEAQPLGGYN
jgi:hypothetical protein